MKELEREEVTTGRNQNEQWMEEALRGNFNEKTIDYFQEKKPKNKLMVFVSSTFTDTHLERNILHQDILPKLQENASRDGIEVILYDMRFGVKDENTKDHMTWISCREAIQQCLDDSDGLFFLSLQGDKYGYCPIPKYVDEQTFKTVFDKENPLQQKATAESLDIMENWYLLDVNNIPNRYELKNLEKISDNTFWSVVLPTLRDGPFDNLPFEVLPQPDADSSTDPLFINRSVTEWETLYALHMNVSQCHWIRRFFSTDSLKELFKDDSPARNPKGWDLSDTWQSASKQMKLEILLSKMKSSLQSSQITEMKDLQLPASSYLEGLSNYECSTYLSQWREQCHQCLLKEVGQVVEKKMQWELSIRTAWKGIPEDFVEDILQHQQLAWMKSVGFIGRQDIIDLAIHRIVDPTTSAHLLVHLAIIGKSGVGKTSLIAKIFLECRQLIEQQHITEGGLRPSFLVRFCGTSKYSIDATDLLRSVILQIIAIYETPKEVEEAGKKTTNLKYQEIVDMLHGLLQKYPMYIFLDSLDQLSDRHEARSKLDFLLKPSSTANQFAGKIIVSSLPDEYDEEIKQWKYLYSCEKRLIEAKVNILRVEPEDLDGVKNTLLRLLQSRNRKLTEDQLLLALTAIKAEPTMLYLNLSINIVQNWRSFDTEFLLQPTVKGIIGQIFDGFERDFGKQFVSWSLAFLTFSRDGMNDVEMKDCLSLQQDVLSEVFQYSSLNSFPMHVWLRLKNAIKGLVIEKEGHCIQWYHRQLRETAEARYSFLKLEGHRILGKYFGNLVEGTERIQREIHTQPLTLNEKTVWSSSCAINTRRVKEGYFHLMEASMYEEARKEICSLEMVCASALVGDGFYLLTALSQLRQISSTPDVEEYFRWLRKDLTSIVKEPRLQLSNTASALPFNSTVRQELEQLIKSSTSASALMNSENTWVRTFNGKMSHDALSMNLQGHLYSITGLSWSLDGQRIVSSSEDKLVKIWDSASGQVTKTLEGHTAAVTDVSWNQSPQFKNLIASCSKDNSLRIWDAITGEVRNQFLSAVENSKFNCVAWNHSGSILASGGDDKMIHFWSITRPDTLPILSVNVDSPVISISWSPDDNQIVSGTYQKSIKIWDTKTGEIVSEFLGHKYPATHVTWSPDGTRIASAANSDSWSALIKIWEPSTGNELFTIEGDLDKINALQWHPDGHHLVAGSGLGQMNKAIRIYDSLTGKVVHRFDQHDGNITALCYNPDGFLLASGGEDKMIKIWDLSSQTVTIIETQGHSKAVVSVCWSPDGRQIASVGGDNLVNIWEESTGQVLHSWSAHERSITCVTWHPHGQSLATSSYDGTIKFWDLLANCQCIRTVKGHSLPIEKICWSVDGSQLASGAVMESVKVWDLPVISSTGADDPLVLTLEGKADRAIAIAWCCGDQKWIAYGIDDNSIMIMEILSANEQPRLLGKLVGHTKGVTSLSWNSTDTRLVSGSEDQSMRIWDVTTLIHRDGSSSATALLLVCLSHTREVTSVCWQGGNEGNLIATGSRDRTVKLWNSQSGECVRSFDCHVDDVSCVSWNRVGNRFVSGSYDSTIKVWQSLVL